MKKTISILLLSGFFFCFFPVQAGNEIQNTNVSVTLKNKQGTKDIKKKKSAKNQTKIADSEKQARELKKKDIENKERLMDKNKKVKKVSVDDNLPETVHKRNIP